MALPTFVLPALLGAAGGAGLSALFGRKKGGAEVIDPLASEKRESAQLGLQQYKNMLPFAGQLQSTYSPRLGQTGFYNKEQTPQMLQDVYNQVGNEFRGEEGPFGSLKKNLLGEYDIGFQRYTQDPLNEKLIKMGLYSSGPGLDVAARAGEEGARGRAMLASQQDMNLLNMAHQFGQEQFDIDQLLGYTQPMGVFNSLSNFRPPTFQDIQTYMPPEDTTGQDIGALLGKLGTAALLANPATAPAGVAGLGAELSLVPQSPNLMPSGYGVYKPSTYGFNSFRR